MRLRGYEVKYDMRACNLTLEPTSAATLQPQNLQAQRPYSLKTCKRSNLTTSKPASAAPLQPQNLQA